MTERQLVGGATVCVVLGIWAYLLFWPIPTLPIGFANGTYDNPCCVTLILHDGEMTLGGRSASYVIETDKGGPYLATEAYVRISDQGKLDIDSKKFPLKLRLGDGSPPPSLALPGDTVGYSFDRK